MRHVYRTPTITVSALALCFAILLPGTASAQVAAPFVGNWKASWTFENKRTFDARFVVTESGGSWQTANQDKSNPCVGRAVPMKVESSGPSEVRFVLQFSEVVAGCPNTTVALRAEADGTVKGIRGDKYELTLVKQK